MPFAVNSLWMVNEQKDFYEYPLFSLNKLLTGCLFWGQQCCPVECRSHSLICCAGSCSLPKMQFAIFLQFPHRELAQHWNHLLPALPTAGSPPGTARETWAPAKWVETAHFTQSHTLFLAFSFQTFQALPHPRAGFFGLPKRWRMNPFNCWSWSVILSIRKNSVVP